MPRKTQRSSANASRVASNKNKTSRETAAQRRAKGVYTKAELVKEKNANKTVKVSGSKRPSSTKADPKKSVLNDPMYSPGTTTKTTNKKPSGTKKDSSSKRKTVRKAKGTTRGVVKPKSNIKSSSTGPKRVVVSKTKKQERQQKRTQRKAKRAADARNKANKILKKTSGTGKKVTSRDQAKLKRLRGKYNRNTK